MSGQPPSCAGCPLYKKGTGFVLGSGNPAAAKIAIMLEAPGKDEVLWRVDDEEFERRRIHYPQIDPDYLRRGQPVVGKAGGILFGWGLAAVQLNRKDLFIDNVLRCLPPKVKDTPYPTGNERKSAEAHCRQYDRWGEFKPTVSLVNIHPAAIAREPSPLPLMIKTFEKAKHFSLGGERPIVLCGGKAAKLWLGHSETVQTWLGHYESETPLSALNREKRREIGMATKVGPKEKKVKKLTARAALELLLKDAAQEFHDGGEDMPEAVKYHIDVRISEEQFKEIAGLIAPRVKKEKV